MSSIVILLGAELNSEVEHQTARDSTTGRERPRGHRGAVMADTVGQSSLIKGCLAQACRRSPQGALPCALPPHSGTADARNQWRLPRRGGFSVSALPAPPAASDPLFPEPLSVIGVE